MSVPLRLVAFGAALVATFVLGLVVGGAVGPEPASPPTVEMHH